MARYIDADKMREKWLYNGENEFVYDTNAILDSIDEQPTADVAEVKHGKWEKKNFIIFDSEKVGYHCSECNTTWDVNTNYCPNCGAKMDGGAE